MIRALRMVLKDNVVCIMYSVVCVLGTIHNPVKLIKETFQSVDCLRSQRHPICLWLRDAAPRP